MKNLFTFVFILLGIAYPFIVYYGLQNFESKWLLPVIMLALSAVRYTLHKTAERKVALIALLMFCGLLLFFSEHIGVKFYPVMMNVAFFVMFAGSLFTPVSFVERLARIKEPDLSPTAIKYTRKVTITWSMFFVLNGTISAITVFFATDKIWMLYNGFISYILIGILGSTEWLIRQKVKKAEDTSNA